LSTATATDIPGIPCRDIAAETRDSIASIVDLGKSATVSAEQNRVVSKSTQPTIINRDITNSRHFTQRTSYDVQESRQDRFS
jgi:hypothetical protein